MHSATLSMGVPQRPWDMDHCDSGELPHTGDPVLRQFDWGRRRRLTQGQSSQGRRAINAISRFRWPRRGDRWRAVHALAGFVTAYSSAAPADSQVTSAQRAGPNLSEFRIAVLSCKVSG